MLAIANMVVQIRFRLQLFYYGDIPVKVKQNPMIKSDLTIQRI